MHNWRPNHGRATSRSGCAAPTRLTELSATDRCRATTDPEYDEFKYADLPVARMRCPPPRRAGGLPVLRFHPMNQAVLPSVSGRELNRRRKPTGSAKPLSATVSWRFGTAYGAHRPGACRSPSMRLCSSSPNGRQKHSTQTVPTSAPVRRRGANRPPRRVRPRTVADAACQPNGKDIGDHTNSRLSRSAIQKSQCRNGDPPQPEVETLTGGATWCHREIGTHGG